MMPNTPKCLMYLGGKQHGMLCFIPPVYLQFNLCIDHSFASLHHPVTDAWRHIQYDLGLNNMTLATSLEMLPPSQSRPVTVSLLKAHINGIQSRPVTELLCRACLSQCVCFIRSGHHILYVPVPVFETTDYPGTLSSYPS